MVGFATLIAVASTGLMSALAGLVDADDLRLASSYSCSPKKTCSKTIRSCEEAYWLYRNCSWGGRLDRDNDGVPCENLCPGG